MHCCRAYLSTPVRVARAGQRPYYCHIIGPMPRGEPPVALGLQLVGSVSESESESFYSFRKIYILLESKQNKNNIVK